MTDSIKTTLTMMAGERIAREDSFDSLEAADAHAQQTRTFSHGITAIRYRVNYGGIWTNLGTWHKGAEQWFYRAAETL
jgi:hypothetical protein